MVSPKSVDSGSCHRRCGQWMMLIYAREAGELLMRIDFPLVISGNFHTRSGANAAK